MRSDAPGLLPIFRSRHQADLLTLLLLHPDREYTITELSSTLAIPQSTVSGEVRRLADAGVVSVRAVGRSRLVRANTESRLVGPLTELLTWSFGPHVVIRDEFRDLAGAQLVLIYGSWAARYNGERGRPPHDVDVLVVGAPDRTALHAAAARAEERLGRPVNPIVCAPQRWADAADPLVQEIQATAYVTVIEHDPVGEVA
ncbi:MAG: ArsR/SmtB family transcription factor [Nocardioidaceae bacterium]